MTPIKNSIIVKVDLYQNDENNLGLKTGRNYNENFRERNPVVAEVINGSTKIPTGSYIVCNYNYFDIESPLQLTDNTFSIPVDEEIFAIINLDGSLTSVCGNIFVERLTKESKIEIPEELKVPHINRGIISYDCEWYKKGQYVFWLPYSDYQIVYMWKGEEKRTLKVHKSEITGYLKKY